MSHWFYNKAFEVQLTHNYYVYTDAPLNNAFKVNKDVAIVPTKECNALMKRGRIRFVPTLKGFNTFYEGYIDGSGDQQPLLKLQNDSEFTFALYLDVAAISLFLNVTDLDFGLKTYTAGKFVMLEHTINSGSQPPPPTPALTASLANSLRGSVFTYNFQPNPDTYEDDADIVVSFGGDDVLTIEDVPYNTITKGYSVEINLQNQPKGFYTLKAYEADTTDEINSNDFYVDADLAVSNAFGIIRIKYETIDRLYDTVDNPAWFSSFRFEFDPRAVVWRYYIVAENLADTFFDNYELKVLKAGGPVFNASFPPTGFPFTQVNGKPDPLIEVNGKKTVIFQSFDPILFSEASPKEYELWKDPIAVGPPDERVIANLPGPNSIGVDSDQWGPAQTPPERIAGISEIYVFL